MHEEGPGMEGSPQQPYLWSFSSSLFSLRLNLSTVPWVPPVQGPSTLSEEEVFQCYAMLGEAQSLSDGKW